MENNTISNIDKYYRKTTANISETSDAKDVIEKYYRELERIRRERKEDPKKIASLETVKLAIDNNNPVFSFNFGLSLLDSFIKINFDTFGIFLLDQFLET